MNTSTSPSIPPIAKTAKRYKVIKLSASSRAYQIEKAKESLARAAAARKDYELLEADVFALGLGDDTSPFAREHKPLCGLLRSQLWERRSAISNLERDAKAHWWLPLDGPDADLAIRDAAREKEVIQKLLDAVQVRASARRLSAAEVISAVLAADRAKQKSVSVSSCRNMCKAYLRAAHGRVSYTELSLCRRGPYRYAVVSLSRQEDRQRY